MYIYNVTVKVDHTIVKAWVHWLKKEHIPEVIKKLGGGVRLS